jgi:hypothetical protein
MDLAGCNFQKHWVYIHGPPSECSGDPEFDNSTFRQYLSHHNVIYKARPARRHNKTGFVESGHSSIKLLARRLAIDIRQGKTQISRSVTFSEILAHAVFLRNVLYGSRTLSSFEQARGYQPSLAGLSVGFVTPDLQNRASISRLSSNPDIFRNRLGDKSRCPARFLTKFGVKVDGSSRQ